MFSFDAMIYHAQLLRRVEDFPPLQIVLLIRHDWRWRIMMFLKRNRFFSSFQGFPIFLLAHEANNEIQEMELAVREENW